MRVMVFVKATGESESGAPPDPAMMAAMIDYNERLAAAGILVDCAGLTPSSAGFRVRFDGPSRIVMGGPFAETGELIAGYWLWEVGSMDEAIDWVRKCPNPMPGPSEVEIRRVMTLEDFGGDFGPDIRDRWEKLEAGATGAG